MACPFGARALRHLPPIDSDSTRPDFLKHLSSKIATFGLAANEPERTFATPPIRILRFRVGCKRTRTDFCNTSYTKLTLRVGCKRTRTDFCSTSYTKLTLSGLGHQLSGSLELEPERIFVAPPVRNAHFRVPPPLGLYII